MPRRKATSGLALVIVLASLVFLVALGVAFLLNSTTELKSSKTFSEGGRSKMLAQTAVSLAMAQISDGTKGVDGGGAPLAWASQPGMIRTYDTTGNPAAWYKLYSSDVMTSSGSFNYSASEQPPANWYQQKAIFTDLNEPTTSGTAKVYPIVDGNNLSLTITDTTTGEQVVTYDDGSGQQAIAGFSMSGTGTPKNPATGSNPAPMPVKWLYVLRQGQLVAPTGGAGNTATFSSPNAPTAANPIIGRVAFWTDDESSKINVNTASEGVYWDTPRAKTAAEDTLKTNQPVTGEYQRYSGHPAMTSLSTVFKKPTGSALTDAQWAQFIYSIVPRVADGGSQAGTVNTAWAATATNSVTTDADRLYASVDEMIFNPARASNATAAGSNQLLNKTFLERAKFFLSANSRSPDVNLFNKPRVCNWPITLSPTSGAPVTTSFDKLIAFCATMRNDLGAGAYRYYFERKDPNSATTDLPTVGDVQGLARNRMLLTYLRTLGGQQIPGFGGSFAAKYGADSDQIFLEMFDYIRGATNLMDPTLTATNRYTVGIPGGTAPWNNRIGQGQVVPIEDGLVSTGTAPLRGFGRYRTVQGASLLFIGQVDGDDPLLPQDASHNVLASGTYPLTSQVDVATGRALPTATVTAVAPGNRRIQAMFLPQFFCPAVGVPWDLGNFQWTVDLSQLRWGPSDGSMSFPSGVHYIQNQKSEDETGFGDQYGLLQVAKQALVTSAPIDLPKGPGTFHFSGGDVTITIYTSGNGFPPATSSTVVQTIVMHFDPADFPLPGVASDQVFDYNNFNPTGIPYNYRAFGASTGTYNILAPNSPKPTSGGRIKTINQAAGWILDADVIRSVGVQSGDTRLVAAQKSPPASLFTTNAKYASTIEHVRGEHNFFDGYGRPYYGAAQGRLVPGLAVKGYVPDAATFPSINLQNSIDLSAKYCFFLGTWSLASDIPLDGVAVGKTTSFTAGDVPGDWDNGPFDVRDGPFINKPDEGDRSTDPSIAPYEWKLKAKAGGGLTQTLFTPNREIPSAVMFGSLPSGVLAGRPWQTLLFRPEPGHPGNRGFKGDGTVGTGMPADHLLLDLFQMPVVEPYAISEPLSTAGRINMNYQIVPFNYINRDTGIRALLKSEKVISIKDSEAIRYKDVSVSNQSNIRLDVNVNETLKGFRRKFDNDKDIFRSASQVCEISMVPTDPAGSPTYDTMASYWTTHRLTGDNSKERIYATLYPRLTTKSNTFTIHFRAQALKKVSGTDPTTWDESKDRITGEFRGSQTVERYIDPNNSQIPDYADPSSTTPISNFYKFRTVLAKQFSP